MSLKDRLAKKTADLTVKPGDTAQSAKSTEETRSMEVRTPRTGPGQMLAFRTRMQENSEQVQGLLTRLQAFEGTVPGRMIDPTLILASKWANRHEASFQSKEFDDLKAEIASAGGNVQPIRVRPHPELENQFEIVFGHRRHQACLQLGLHVLALVEAFSDKQLFFAMDRENRNRADLSAFEQGVMYRRAIDEGLYPSLRQLATELGVDVGNVSKAIAIARLPSEVLAAFEHPTQVQFRWGQSLVNAIRKDAEGVISRAKSLEFAQAKLSPQQAMEQLLGISKANKSAVRVLETNGIAIGKLARHADGSILLTLNRGVLSDKQYKQLDESVQALLNK
jgi:ParB family transcriptional regulator, chromosome partitioning protein